MLNSLLKNTRRLLPGCSIEDNWEPIGLWPSGDWHTHHQVEVGGKADGNPAFSDRSDRSWRNMQVCDPPISVVSLSTQVQPHVVPGEPYPEEEEPEICAAVQDRGGVTIGMVFDTAAALLRGTDSSYPCFRMSFGIDIPNELPRPQDNDDGNSDDGSDPGDEGGGEDRRGQGDDRDENGGDRPAAETLTMRMREVTAADRTEAPGMHKSAASWKPCFRKGQRSLPSRSCWKTSFHSCPSARFSRAFNESREPGDQQLSTPLASRKSCSCPRKGTLLSRRYGWRKMTSRYHASGTPSTSNQS